MTAPVSSYMVYLLLLSFVIEARVILVNLQSLSFSASAAALLVLLVGYGPHMTLALARHSKEVARRYYIRPLIDKGQVVLHFLPLFSILSIRYLPLHLHSPFRSQSADPLVRHLPTLSFLSQLQLRLSQIEDCNQPSSSTTALKRDLRERSALWYDILQSVEINDRFVRSTQVRAYCSLKLTSASISAPGLCIIA